MIHLCFIKTLESLLPIGITYIPTYKKNAENMAFFYFTFLKKAKTIRY